MRVLFVAVANQDFCSIIGLTVLYVIKLQAHYSDFNLNGITAHFQV